MPPSIDFGPVAPPFDQERYWPGGEDRPDYAWPRGPQPGVNVEVREIELNGELLDNKKLYKFLAPIMEERAKKIIKTAHKNIYGGDGTRTKSNPTEKNRGHVPLKSGMQTDKPEFYGDEGVDVGITVISRHASPVEFGSGLYNTARVRTRSKRYAETKGGRQAIAAGGKFYVTPRKANSFILVPLKGRFRSTAKSKWAKKREEERRVRTIGGVKYVIVAYALQSGQKEKRYLRDAVNAHRLALLSDLRRGVIAYFKQQINPNNVSVDMTVSVT